MEEAVKALAGSTFGIEGDEKTRKALASLAEELGGTPIFLRPEDKALYHATVVMAGGVLNTLIGAVAELWAQFGIERNDALKAITPIMAGPAETLFRMAFPDAGPVVRSGRRRHDSQASTRWSDRPSSAGRVLQEWRSRSAHRRREGRRAPGKH